MTATPDPVSPGGQVVYQITVTNQGSERADAVDVRSVLPAHTDAKEGNTDGDCDGSDNPFACNAGETIKFDVGDLPAGESAVVSYAAQVRTGEEAPPEGSVIDGSATASSFQGGGASASADAVVDSSPALSLTMEGAKSPVEPEEEQTYTLTYSVPGESSLSGTSLQAAVPSGASFVSATGGGSLNGGQVQWDLGTVEPGEGGHRTFTVEAGSDLSEGALLTSEAEASSGSNAARGQTATAVDIEAPIRLAMTASPDPVSPGGQVVYQITVTNQGSERADAVDVRSVLPAHTDAKEGNTDGDCDGSDNPFACNAGETIKFDVGDLPAGESAVVSYAAQVRTGEEAPPEGSVIDGSATASSFQGGGASASADAVVDSSPALSLTMEGAKSPVEPEEEQTYTLTYSVPGESSLSGTSLQAAVPSGASFVSATGGGSLNGGQVQWDLGTVEPGEGGHRTFTVEAGSDLSEGALLTSEAEASSGSNAARGQTATAVDIEAPIRLAMTASPDPVSPGGQVLYQITVTNQGSERADAVDVRSVLPAHTDAKEDNTDGDCDGFDNPFGCNAGETIKFDVGDLPAGESAVVSYAAQVRTGEEAPPEGSVLDGNATASSFQGGGASASADVIFGTLDDGEDTTPIIEARNQGPESTVTVEGTVTRAFGSYVRLQDESGPTGASALIVRQTSDNSLAQAFRDDIANGNITQGTQLEVTGTLSEFTGLLQIDNEDLSDYAIGEQGTVPAAQVVSLSDIQGPDGEDYESELIRVEAVSFADPGATGGTLDALTSYDIEDGDGTTFAYVVQESSETAVIGASIPPGTFTYEGVLGQFDGFSGNDEGYQLYPVRVSTGLPVELTDFKAVRSGSSVELRWQTASETNNDGFRVERRAGESEGWTRVAFVESKADGGVSQTPTTYRFQVSDLEYGQHTFRLVQRDLDGSETPVGTQQRVQIELSKAYDLSAPRPNPFSERAIVDLAVREKQDVTVAVYDVLGRRVQVLHEGPMSAQQTKHFTVRAQGLSSGTYFVRVVGKAFTETRRLVLTR
jgi:uncharacterized repeat protein (TIGR01451 family)